MAISILRDRRKWIESTWLYLSYSVFTNGSKMEGNSHRFRCLNPRKNIRVSQRQYGNLYDTLIFTAILVRLKTGTDSGTLILENNMRVSQRLRTIIQAEVIAIIKADQIIALNQQVHTMSLSENYYTYHIRLCCIQSHHYIPSIEVTTNQTLNLKENLQELGTQESMQGSIER